MSIQRLTVDQVRQVHKRATRDLPYLCKLVARMEKIGFVPGDDVYDAAVKAKDAMQGLHMALHYATCSGVGRDEGERARVTTSPPGNAPRRS